MTNDQGKTRPAAEVRLGNIRAAIWQNEGENGAWFNVTFERTYREGEEYHSAQSFGRDDLLTLAKVADLANSRIFELQRQSRKAAA